MFLDYAKGMIDFSDCESQELCDISDNDELIFYNYILFIYFIYNDPFSLILINAVD